MTSTPLPAVPEPLVALGVTLRLRCEDDDAFLRQVYYAYRWEELTLTDWPEEARIAFLDQQYNFQRIHYDRNYPAAVWGIVEVAGEPAGRLYLQYAGQDLRIIDVAFLPPFRNQGIGTGLLTAVQELARGLSATKASIHVEQNNPALRLYQRLGFEIVLPRPPYYLLEWPIN